MPRISSRRSDGSEMEIDGLAEQELLRLQQEYRIMEGDRKAYSEESQNIIRKQREAITALQAENEELMKENRLAGSQQNETKDSQNIDKLSTMLQKEKEIKIQIQLVKETIANYDNEIYQNERNISQQRKGMGGVNMSQAKHVALQKQIRLLENRLDQGNRKFNQSLAKNSDLRSAIDHMRTERTIFQGLHDKLEKRVKENKETIANIIEASTSSYDGRDDAQNKMIALKEKSDKELLQYNMELKELLRIIDHDRKLREFMNIKSEDRVEMHGLKLNYTNNRGDEREKGGEKEDSIQCYEKAFEQIKEATQIDDLQLLVGKFIETEDKNFALFNYVNELNNEIELMQERIADTESNIRTFKEESLHLDEQRHCIMKQMEEKNLSVEDDVSVHETKVKTADKMLTQLKEGIQSLFTKINCDPSAIMDMLGGHAGITNGNLMQFLGIIEQRSNELIQVQVFVSTKDTDSSHDHQQAVSLLGKGPLPMPTPITVNPPTTGDEYDTDFSAQSDDENRPLTQQELRNRIVRGISKREGSKAEKEHRNIFSADDPLEERTSMKKSHKARSPMKDK